VTVRLINSGETERSIAMVGIAGKYIFEEKPENVAATETIVTINAFWRRVKMLYGTGTAETVSVCPGEVFSIIREMLVCSEGNAGQRAHRWVYGFICLHSIGRCRREAGEGNRGRLAKARNSEN
jgi:hypothetical protein